MKADETVIVGYDAIRFETDNAYLLEIDGEEVWLPKSHCELNPDEDEAHIPEWLAIEKGLGE